MTYVSVPITSFGGGLHLRDQGDVRDAPQALDALNVSFSERGAVRQRDGYARLTTTALTNQPDSLFGFYTSDGEKRLLVGNGNRVDVLESFPGASAASTTATASPHFFARFGGPVREAVYLANGVDALKRYDTVLGFTEPGTLSAIAPKFLAVQSPDNRLVAANFVGTTGPLNPSAVKFSNAGDPETFDSDNYVQLDPGDGEPIMGLATWGPYVFAFKQSKIFQFYGNTVDSLGGTVFSVRKVSDTVGLVAPKAIAVARDGVYFLDRKGVYRTQGSEPEQVSDVLDPFFFGAPSIYFRSPPANQSEIDQAAMWLYDERVYLSLPTGTSATNDATLVFNPRYGWWSLYDLPVAAGTSFRPASKDELVFAYAAGGNHVGRQAPTYTADDMTTSATDGEAIVSRWRSGWFDGGDPDVKTLREVKLWGEGIVEVRVTKDYLDAGTDETKDFGGSLTTVWADAVWVDASWETVRTITPQLVRQGRRGTVFSLIFSHSVLNEPWAIHRADLHLRSKRVPSVTRSEVAA